MREAAHYIGGAEGLGRDTEIGLRQNMTQARRPPVQHRSP